jgi:hypothetical protein
MPTMKTKHGQNPDLVRVELVRAEVREVLTLTELRRRSKQWNADIETTRAQIRRLEGELAEKSREKAEYDRLIAEHTE